MPLTLPCPHFPLSILTGGRLRLCPIGFLGKVVLKALHSWEERDQPYSLPFVHSYRVYCMLGDGEVSEGSVWEAMAFAGIYKLDNLVAIFDINRLGQSDPAPLQHQVDVYQKRCEAFGYV